MSIEYNIKTAYNVVTAAQQMKKQDYITDSFMFEVYDLLSKDPTFTPDGDKITEFVKGAASKFEISLNRKK